MWSIQHFIYASAGFITEMLPCGLSLITATGAAVQTFKSNEVLPAPLQEYGNIMLKVRSSVADWLTNVAYIVISKLVHCTSRNLTGLSQYDPGC